VNHPTGCRERREKPRFRYGASNRVVTQKKQEPAGSDASIASAHTDAADETIVRRRRTAEIDCVAIHSRWWSIDAAKKMLNSIPDAFQMQRKRPIE
jgi:hypothetical protein